MRSHTMTVKYFTLPVHDSHLSYLLKSHTRSSSAGQTWYREIVVVCSDIHNKHKNVALLLHISNFGIF
jgi:hypothetical protein